jgi:hypothetical protein
MEWSGIASLVVMLGLTILSWWQYRPCRRALRDAWKRGPQSLTNDHAPPACIVLCLRGSDPFLDRCLDGLIHQDYPDYELLVVVDSETDEALPHVRRAEKEFGSERVQVVVRDVNLSTCTRKCSSLRSAYDRIHDRIQVVATCDGDTVTHPTWLRELVAPMHDPKVLATTGNRWYAPPDHDWAGFIRYYWNAMAFPAMVAYHIPWGGSLAIRSDVFRDPVYLDYLAHAFSEDTQLARYLATKNTSAVSVIPLVMLNEERTTFHSLWGFLQRQMLAARLHHHAWPLVLGNAVAVGLVSWVMLPLTILGGMQNFLLGWVIPATIYSWVVTIEVGRFERLVRRTQREWHGRSLPGFGPWRILATYFTPTATAYFYSVAVIVAWLSRRHEWRGITYQLERRGVSILPSRTPPTSAPPAPTREKEEIDSTVDAVLVSRK